MDATVKENWSTGKTVGVILGSIAAAGVLFFSFVLSTFFMGITLGVLEKRGQEYEEASQKEYEGTSEREQEYDREDSEEEKQEKEEDGTDDAMPEEEWDGMTQQEYYEFANALRDDLSYQVTFEEMEKKDFENCKGETKIYFRYPVVDGENVINLEGINAAIQKEIEVVEKSAERNADYLTEEESYYFEGICYVTYMSEEILSLAYVEYGYLNGEFLESYVVSVNVDMQTGMILDNTKLLDIDDDFSIDFRKRSEKQNGEIQELSYFSDQDITASLTNRESLILFYTPLGMEVGFNFYGGWATVTYQDYEEYQKQL